MKHKMSKIWAAICSVGASTASILTVHATEQGADVAESVNLMTTMDVLQKVCVVIIIIAAVLLLAFYIAKMILKKMHVPPEVNPEKKIDQNKE